MSDSDSNASFTTLLARACRAASSSSGKKNEEAILSHFLHLNRLAQSLNLISINEELRDISTPSLRALFLPSLTATAYTQQRSAPSTSNPEGLFEARKTILRHAQEQAKTFLSTVSKLNILPASTLSLLNARNVSSQGSASASAATQAAQSRQLKIALFKLERSLQSALDAFRSQARAVAAKRRGNSVRAPAAGIQSTSAPAVDPESAAPEDPFYDLLILGADGDNDQGDDDEEEEEEEKGGNGRELSLAAAEGSGGGSSSAPSAAAQPTSLRSYLLLNLNLHALKSFALLESVQQELTLLANMPPQESLRASQQQQQQQDRERARGSDGDVSWKLDTPIGGGLSSAPLLDPKGRPLRPFTITPSMGSSSAAAAAGQPQDLTAHRAALKQQVFQPSHRLPTMSIDDYLAEEERRGNVLRGGGPEGAAKPTPKEERAIRAELDGTVQGWQAEEEERQEKIKWDKWADEHRRGEGNTMNRG